ncbi:NUDIX domain-containing protein [Paenibacillus lautus]|uniref:NUDIX domain-containing protein n=1 Tax=Paenibacillus lautus TaxID=1401 RepID=UPI001FE775F2|nr:NUDIX hydrolase [Paenibacillus lautus]
MTENGNVLVVSVTLFQGDQVLIIQENKPSVRDTWTFPGGRIEPGEAMFEAAIREVKEETGYDVQLTSTTGVYPFISSLNHPVIMFHFTGEVVGARFNWELARLRIAGGLSCPISWRMTAWNSGMLP